MAMPVLIHDQERMYELLSDEAGGIYLSVLCGGIAMYEVTIKLNEDEMERYREGGKGFIDKLALDICKDTDAFSSRHVHLANR